MNSTGFDFDLFFSTSDEPIYCLDKEIYLSSLLHIPFIHIATAGGLVHENIYKRQTHAQIRKKIKLLHNDIKMDFLVNPNLDKILDQKKILNDESYTFNRESYLHDFIEYAKCGFLSFDRTILNKPSDNGYHLVAYPIFDENYPEIIKNLFNMNLKRYNHRTLNKYIQRFVTHDLNANLHGEHLVLKMGARSQVVLSM